MRGIFTGGADIMSRHFVFYVIVAGLTIVLGVIGMALYACGVK